MDPASSEAPQVDADTPSPSLPTAQEHMRQKAVEDTQIHHSKTGRTITDPGPDRPPISAPTIENKSFSPDGQSIIYQPDQGTSPALSGIKGKIRWRRVYPENPPKHRGIQNCCKSHIHHSNKESGGASVGTGKAARPAKRTAQAAPTVHPHDKGGDRSVTESRCCRCKSRVLNDKRHRWAYERHSRGKIYHLTI